MLILSENSKAQNKTPQIQSGVFNGSCNRKKDFLSAAVARHVPEPGIEPGTFRSSV